MNPTSLKHKIRVLYVDDEVHNLAAFKAGFRRDYEIFTAVSVAEGMNILTEHEIHVVIADQKMPKATGVEFFNIIRTSHPEPVRILMTGYADVDSVIDAINKGEIFRYIKKPWDELQLRSSIQNAYEVYATRRELNNKITELQKTNDELNRFVYSTSHDLRSPLASIMGVLNLAKLEQSVDDPNNYLGMIETCTQKMDVFIHKVIEYYKNIRVEDVNESINFKKLIDDCIELCRMQNPSIIFDSIINQEADFIGDEFRLSVILNNLISNAVKYQKPNEEFPTVKIRVTVSKDEAVIDIGDNGVGIINDHLNNIFDMFFRSNNNVTGLGIGLHIVKEALTRIGGNISVTSEKGKGTNFKMTIPNKTTG